MNFIKAQYLMITHYTHCGVVFVFAIMTRLFKLNAISQLLKMKKEITLNLKWLVEY